MAQSMTAVRSPFEVQREQLRTLVSHAATPPSTVSVDFQKLDAPLLRIALISLVGFGRFEKLSVARDTSYDTSRPRDAVHSESGRVYWLEPGNLYSA